MQRGIDEYTTTDVLMSLSQKCIDQKTKKLMSV